MKNYIDSSDVKKRMRILKEQADCSQITSTKTCFNLYEVANKTKDYMDILAFFKECGQGAYNADAYLDKCIGLLEESGDTRVMTAFQDFILPIATRPALAEAYSSQFSDYSDKTRNLIKRQYDYDLAMEQISEFHDAILAEGKDLVEFANDSRNPDAMVIFECCSHVCNVSGNLPMYVAAIASVNEALYVLQESGRNSNTFCVVMEVADYFHSRCRIGDEDFNNFINGLERDPLCKGYYIEGFTNPNNGEKVPSLKDDIKREYEKASRIQSACYKFLRDGSRDTATINAFKATVLKGSVDDLQNNFVEFLKTLLNECLNHSQEESKFICSDIIPDIYEGVTQIAINNTSVSRELITKVISQIDEVIVMAENYLKSDCSDSAKENIIYYKNSLSKLKDDFENNFDFMYPSYAAECAFSDLLFEADSNTKSVKDFKIFKFDNIVTRCYKIDKYLINQFNGFKDKVKKSLDKVNEKIFGEASVYEMLTPEGNLDYCVTSFDVTGIDSFKEYHDFCTSCIKYINTEILKEDNFICYYQLNPDTLEFRIRENLNLELTEEDKLFIEKTLPIEDIYRINMLTEASSVYPNFNFIIESQRYFIANPDSDMFNLYLEASAMAGVPKETINEIYQTLKETTTASFIVGTSYNASSYEPLNADINTVLESVNALELILEADKPLTDRQKAAQARKAAQLAQWEKEEEEEEARKNGKKPDKPVADKKVNNNVKKPEPNKANKPEDKNKESNSGEGIDKIKAFFNNMKLYVHAIRGKMKDADAKIKTAMHNMDDTVNRLGKGIKQALVSDRREAIIKGSVIPSFHKCLMIAAAEAGLWALNPPLAIIAAIGGFAASKKLTKKERFLLYDDIQIEMKILDKEIQRADEKNQIKKLRELMRMKKELERQANRIKYNIRIGKDRVPSGRYVNMDNESDY